MDGKSEEECKAKFDYPAMFAGYPSLSGGGTFKPPLGPTEAKPASVRKAANTIISIADEQQAELDRRNSTYAHLREVFDRAKEKLALAVNIVGMKPDALTMDELIERNRERIEGLRHDRDAKIELLDEASRQINKMLGTSERLNIWQGIDALRKKLNESAANGFPLAAYAYTNSDLCALAGLPKFSTVAQCVELLKQKLKDAPSLCAERDNRSEILEMIRSVRKVLLDIADDSSCEGMTTVGLAERAGKIVEGLERDVIVKATDLKTMTIERDHLLARIKAASNALGKIARLGESFSLELCVEVLQSRKTVDASDLDALRKERDGLLIEISEARDRLCKMVGNHHPAQGSLSEWVHLVEGKLKEPQQGNVIEFTWDEPAEEPRSIEWRFILICVLFAIAVAVPFAGIAWLCSLTAPYINK